MLFTRSAKRWNHAQEEAFNAHLSVCVRVRFYVWGCDKRGCGAMCCVGRVHVLLSLDGRGTVSVDRGDSARSILKTSARILTGSPWNTSLQAQSQKTSSFRSIKLNFQAHTTRLARQDAHCRSIQPHSAPQIHTLQQNQQMLLPSPFLSVTWKTRTAEDEHRDGHTKTVRQYLYSLPPLVVIAKLCQRACTLPSESARTPPKLEIVKSFEQTVKDNP